MLCPLRKKNLVYLMRTTGNKNISEQMDVLVADRKLVALYSYRYSQETKLVIEPRVYASYMLNYFLC